MHLTKNGTLFLMLLKVVELNFLSPKKIIKKLFITLAQVNAGNRKI